MILGGPPSASPPRPKCLVLHASFSIPNTCLDYKQIGFTYEDPKNAVLKCSRIEFEWPVY